LAEHLPRDWQTPGYGEIVCHCELVTRREIEAALASPVPPGDFGGLRRRTRAAMGRSYQRSLVWRARNGIAKLAGYGAG
jgi:glycerol-3-phosphate dehydrogenase